MKFDTLNDYKKHLKKMYRGIHIFSFLIAIGIYLVIGFVNWNLDISSWGTVSRMSLAILSIVFWILLLVGGVHKESTLDKMNTDLLPPTLKNITDKGGFQPKKSTFQTRLEEEAKKRRNTN